MPSMKRIFFFGKKKNQGSKFHEFHGYDNLRHSAYPMSPSHPPPPPHSFSQRQQLYPQQILQPQIITQCQCQQCSYQHQQHQQQQQLLLQQQQQQQQQAQQQQLGQQQLSQVQLIPQSQPQPPQPQLQLQLQPQSQLQPQPQVQQHCQQQSIYHYPSAQHYVSQTTQLQPTATVAQCICQHCPYQHQHQQQQQQLVAGQQQIPLGLVQVNGACQHQQQINQIQTTQLPVHQQYHPHAQVIQHNQIATQPPQLAPTVLRSTTPSMQLQQQQPTAQLLQPQQFQCHTIQPQQYQQQKQQQQQHQQQQHQRVQSLHQQSQPTYQLQSQSQVMVQSQHQIQTKRHQAESPMESQSEYFDCSRYANMQSLLDDVSLRKRNKSPTPKFQEHVYCNEKLRPDSLLPPYEPPPDYSTFIEQQMKATALDRNGQHSTYNSESLVWQETKDSSYENLRTSFSPYSNLGIGKLEPGYTN